jgi:hypothetical protein
MLIVIAIVKFTHFAATIIGVFHEATWLESI